MMAAAAAAAAALLQQHDHDDPSSTATTTTTSTAGAGETPATDDSSSSSGGIALKKGPWTSAEDAILIEYVKKYGEGNWNAVQKNSGLSRCGKSCRLRWANHLRPNLKKGSFCPEEERLILELHAKLGNKWARMAAQLPGRTDNEIKNYWNTRIKRRQRAGLPLYPADMQRQATAVRTSPASSSADSVRRTKLLNQLFDSMKPPPSISFFDPLLNSPHFPPVLNHNPSFSPSTHVHRFKRLREPGFGFLQQNPTDLPSFVPNLAGFTKNFQPQQPILFNSGNGVLDSMVRRVDNPYEPPDVSVSGAFSVKMELPSSQFAESVSSNAGLGAPVFDINNSDSPPAKLEFSGNGLSRKNSGLLDALLQEAEAMACNGVGGVDQKPAILPQPVAGKCSFDGWIGDTDPANLLVDVPSPPAFSDTTPHWEDSTPSAQSSIGITMKKEPVEECNSVDEELSNLLDFIPPLMPPVLELYGDSSDMSNGQQSSGVTEDNLGLEMQQLTSSLSVPDQIWELDSCPWNNMPGIC